MTLEDVLSGNAQWSCQQADAIEFANSLPHNAVDLCLFSPPYEAQRAYAELEFSLTGEDLVSWMFRVVEALAPKVNGLIAINCEGRTKNYKYSSVPQLLHADLHRDNYNMRKPLCFYRSGIPGSGGPDWFRNNWENIICITRSGRLPWSENTAMGHAPKYELGGELSHRTLKDGRVNEKRKIFRHNEGNTVKGSHDRNICEIANPGNVIQQMYTAEEVEQMLANEEAGDIIKCKVGGGHLGDDFAHKNEAPFPERLCEFIIRSCCPPNGIVLDPMCGSGTTGKVAVKFGRRFIGCDLRQSQVELCHERMASMEQGLFAGETK